MENGTYTHDLVYDYPSVSQLNYAAKENNINLIFAITNKRDAYERLQKAIENSEVGILSGHSSNVVNLVEENYKVTSSDGDLTCFAVENFRLCCHLGQRQNRRRVDLQLQLLQQTSKRMQRHPRGRSSQFHKYH